MKPTYTIRDVNKLREYDHVFLNEAGVAMMAERFGLKGKIKPYLHRATPNEVKGLTLANGAKAAIGMDATVLGMRICDLLGVKYEGKFGRGSQLRACCDALERHFGEEK